MDDFPGNTQGSCVDLPMWYLQLDYLLYCVREREAGRVEADTFCWVPVSENARGSYIWYGVGGGFEVAWRRPLRCAGYTFVGLPSVVITPCPDWKRRWVLNTPPSWWFFFFKSWVFPAARPCTAEIVCLSHARWWLPTCRRHERKRLLGEIGVIWTCLSPLPDIFWGFILVQFWNCDEKLVEPRDPLLLGRYRIFLGKSYFDRHVPLLWFFNRKEFNQARSQHVTGITHNLNYRWTGPTVLLSDRRFIRETGSWSVVSNFQAVGRVTWYLNR